jgi:hypothetical protein
MLVIVGIFSNADAFPLDALVQVDAALAGAGYKKEIRSVLRPGKEFSITYEGPTADKSRFEYLLKPIAEGNRITFTVEVEESVRFP